MPIVVGLPRRARYVYVRVCVCVCVCVCMKVYKIQLLYCSNSLSSFAAVQLLIQRRIPSLLARQLAIQRCNPILPAPCMPTPLSPPSGCSRDTIGTRPVVHPSLPLLHMYPEPPLWPTVEWLSGPPPVQPSGKEGFNCRLSPSLAVALVVGSLMSVMYVMYVYMYVRYFWV